LKVIPPSSALIIIDIINSFQFEHGKTLAEKTFHIVKPLITLKDSFKKLNMPIIYVNDHYNLWQANLPKLIKHCQNDHNQPFLQDVIPSEDDYFLIKPKHSAFYGTALNILLHQLQVKTLFLTGIAGNICVLFTANDAYMREYKLLIPKDCLASVHDDDQAYALKMMKNVLSAEIILSNDYIK
jgi:nicotinamidase-related amidase